MGTCESSNNRTGVKFVQPEKSIDPKNFYDVIVSINSIMDIIKNGWLIKFSERFQNNHQNMINDKTLKIGIIGNSNKGKSFILSKLSKIDLPAGTNIKTEGLSIKYPDLEKFKDRRITLLDSAGLETPVLKENNENNEKFKMNNNNGKQQKEKDESEVEDEVEGEMFKEKSREKIITESFLQNYIIHNSDILLVVVGILTYSEQKILNKIRINLQKGLLKKQNNTLCVIHNLMTYTSVAQVESYIKETLLKSATFNLEKNMKINVKTETQTGVCYYEKNSDTKIFHLIFANDYSVAGRYYNNYTLSFIENLFETNINLKEFNIIETIKRRFKEFSKEVFENLQGEIEFDNSQNFIKLKNPKKLTLKQFFIDELGFSYMKENTFEPNYNYYKTKDKIIVKIEAPGNCKIESDTKYSGEYVIIKVSGTKENEDNKNNIESNFYNGRKFGQFSLNIPIRQEGFTIKNEETKIEKEDGIFKLTFQLEDIKSKGIFLPKKNKF